MKIVFAGTPHNAAQALRAISKYHEVSLVITREDAAVGRDRQLQPSPVAAAAKELGLVVHKSNQFDAQTQDAVRNSGASLAVVIAFGALIPESALSIMPWWNIHFSLLPKWRGASPLQQSMLHDVGVGITIFEIDKGLDTGAIISQKALVIEPKETYGEALERFTREGIELILENLKLEPKRIAQTGEPSYAPKIARSDAKLRFNVSAAVIDRQVRAFNPEPIAWAEYGGQVLRVLSGNALGEIDWSSLDGTMSSEGSVLISNDRVMVCCAEGTRYELLEVQPAGKKVMKASDWARGLRGEVHFD